MAENGKLNLSAARPRAVVFDLGKVLLDFDYGRAAQAMAPYCRVKADTIRHALDQSPLLVRFETGSITAQEMYAEVVRATGYTRDFATFSEVFGDIFTEIPAMIAAQVALQKRDVPTYIFSNTNALAVDFVRRRHPFFGGFAGHIYSHEAQCMKPESKIYEAVERRSGCQQSELLYIDDRAENIAAGVARGWQVIHHVELSSSLAALNERFDGLT